MVLLVMQVLLSGAGDLKASPCCESAQGAVAVQCSQNLRDIHSALAEKVVLAVSANCLSSPLLSNTCLRTQPLIFFLVTLALFMTRCAC